MIYAVKVYKPTKTGKLVISKRKSLTQEQADNDYWVKMEQHYGHRALMPYTCERCKVKGRATAKSQRYCPECARIVTLEKARERKEQRRRTRGIKFCDVKGCNNPIPFDAGSGAKRCSDKCRKEGARERARQDYNDAQKASYTRRMTQKAAQMKLRGEKRRERGIVCKECGGPIPDERIMANYRCSPKCDELIVRKWVVPADILESPFFKAGGSNENN